MNRDITDEYTDYMYNNYYNERTNWNEYYERIAEEEDRYYDEFKSL